MLSTNVPYKKVYNALTGKIDNPITKEKPYLSGQSDKGGKKFRKTNNKKGISLLIRRIGVLTFEKSHIVKQYFYGKTIPHLVTK